MGRRGDCRRASSQGLGREEEGAPRDGVRFTNTQALPMSPHSAPRIFFFLCLVSHVPAFPEFCWQWDAALGDGPESRRGPGALGLFLGQFLASPPWGPSRASGEADHRLHGGSWDGEEEGEARQESETSDRGSHPGWRVRMERGQRGTLSGFVG